MKRNGERGNKRERAGWGDGGARNNGTKEWGRERKWAGTLQSVNVTYISASL